MTHVATSRRIVGAVSGLLLAALLCAVLLRGGAPFALDTACHRWVLDHRGRALTDLAVTVTRTGAGVCAYGLAAAGGALALRRPWPWRWWPAALVAMAALLVGQALRTGLAALVGRARPPAADWITHPSGQAFPSGHTTTSTLLAIGVAVVLHRRAGRPATRVAAVVIPGLWAFSVGASRVLLGVHWTTDVLAGWLLGTLVACICLPALAAVLHRIRPDSSGDD
ncbi:phosphatase PAP2 family protein [Frankia sp. Ag45/Mut15]|uniref:Phosphatase PAP2 family protein n=1 Tax=Frankia umida TaxID=573489 RepID=A0ABT0K1A6_9ACTN|nr:phosphatase PAP2 family protein [Frankia umida]MCK9877038.1 phosphatase PAP2 family protein [Frankia umida]